MNLRERSMSATDWLVDIVIFAGALGFGLLQLTLSVNLIIPDDFTRRLLGIQTVSPSLFAIFATALTCAPVIIRRLAPSVSFGLSLFFWMASQWFLSTSMLSLIGVLVTLFTLSYMRDKTHTIVAGIVASVCVLMAPLANVSTTLTSLLVLQNTALIIAVCLAGYSLHTSSMLAKSARMQADEEAKLRQSEALRAVEAMQMRDLEASHRLEEERVRIAREVHDITAHSLSAVSVQAAMAERLLESDPKRAREALLNIREVSKNSLDELRGVIGVLRGDKPAQENPIMTLDDISELSGYLQQADIDCEIDEQISAGVHVPLYVSSALFGIAREAVTNVVRHSGAKAVRISVIVRDSFAEVSVIDDGRGVPDADFDGHGIEGMRERAKALGGSFEIRGYHEGETRVIARIPLAGRSTQ